MLHLEVTFGDTISTLPGKKTLMKASVTLDTIPIFSTSVWVDPSQSIRQTERSVLLEFAEFMNTLVGKWRTGDI